MDSMLFFGRDRVTSNLLILPLNYLQIFILFFTQSLKHWQISQKVKRGGTVSTKKNNNNKTGN